MSETTELIAELRKQADGTRNNTYAAEGAMRRAADALEALQTRIDEAQARLQVPMHPYSDKRIPKVPEIDFLRDAYGEELPNDLVRILSGGES